MLVNTLSPSDLVGYFLDDSGAEVAIVESGLCHLFSSETVRETRLQIVVVANGPVPDRLPVAAVQWSEWTGAQPSTMVAADTGRDDMAFWMYSTGSTGRPKGNVHLQHDMAYTHAAYGERVLGIRVTDVCYSPPKIFFAYGLGNSITFPFSVGASSVLSPGRPEAAIVFNCIERFRPTLFFGLPTLYNALVNDSRAESADLSSIRLCLSAAETLSSELFGAWKNRFGFEIVEGLGSTELLHIYLSNTPARSEPGSAGLRVPGYELKLLDHDAIPVASDESGTLWVRGDSSAPCYWNKPDKTAETMREDWICTGDRFRVDEDGFYFFQGRTDDLIKVSGQWVYPLEIELCLADHPAVRECAVLGTKMADERMTTKVFVVVADRYVAGEELSQELRDFVKARLLPYKYPRIIEYRADLPKTGTGKIDRQRLLSAENENVREGRRVVNTELGTVEELPKSYVESLRNKGTLPLWPGLRKVLPFGIPERRTRPFCWRYGELRDEVLLSGELTPIDKAERRVIVLANPSLGLDNMMATPTIYLGLQLILPGETAPNHRHTPSAVRFVVEGEGAFTTVEGQKCTMEKGDLILTPSGLWHEHGHEGKGPVVWLDALDLPLLYYLDASYCVEGKSQNARNAADASQTDYRRAGLIPYDSLTVSRGDFPLLRYPWAEVRGALMDMAAGSDIDGSARLAYVNPETGNPCLPVLGFSAEMIGHGREVRPRRRSCSAVFHVIEGRGESQIDDQTFVWSEGDTLAVPTHGEVVHRAAGVAPAFLFHVDDAPLQRTLGFYEEF